MMLHYMLIRSKYVNYFCIFMNNRIYRQPEATKNHCNSDNTSPTTASDKRTQSSRSKWFSARKHMQCSHFVLSFADSFCLYCFRLTKILAEPESRLHGGKVLLNSWDKHFHWRASGGRIQNKPILFCCCYCSKFPRNTMASHWIGWIATMQQLNLRKLLLRHKWTWFGWHILPKRNENIVISPFRIVQPKLIV